MNSIFFEITIILCLASVLSIIFRTIKQPPIIAYIITGILIGSVHIYQLSHEEVIHAFGEFGITFLLFMLGLELRLSDLKSVGKTVLIIGVGQILFTSIIGFGIGMILGFSLIHALYLAVALTFSSTVVIVKLLADKKDQNSLYGRLAIGILLVQDFAAILILIFLSSLGSSGFSIFEFLLITLKAVLLFSITILASRYVIPKIIEIIARSQEILFIFSIAFAFLVASIVSSPLVGFSIEIGGFLAGLALANSAENYHIVSRIRPLRDFFITLFFVLLGTQMAVNDLGSIWFPAVIFSIFILVGNPFIVFVLLGVLGFHKRVAFLTGLTIAQISEFSLILIFLGQKNGHLNQEIVSLVSLIGIITFTMSTYLILNGNLLYRKVSSKIDVFDKRSKKTLQSDLKEYSNHIVLVGANRTGEVILDELEEHDEEFLVIDFDPAISIKLKSTRHNFLFGDISDQEIQDKASIGKAKLIISTNTDIEDNVNLLRSYKSANPDGKFIALSHDKYDARDLYDAGVDYVVIPRFSSGKYIAEIIEDGRLSQLAVLKKRDLKDIS